MESKLDELAKKIVNYSVKVNVNERVLINTYVNDSFFIKRLIYYITLNKGIPFVRINDESINSYLLETANENRYQEIKQHGLDDVNNYDIFINIRYTTNDYSKKNIDENTLKNIALTTKESDYIRINERKWVLLNYPSNVDAYKAKMTTDTYKNYALDVMIFDYEKMNNDIAPLKKLMEQTDIVRITGPNTDIEFSIKDIPVIPCVGEANLPDGEIYTAPVRESVNGLITYNTPSPYNGNIYHKVSLLFKDGKIVEAKCDENNEEINKIFNTDEGARYVGEFSFGLNPLIRNPMGDILYDEKIIGSIHFTPGQAYKDAYNGNDSGIHWDLVLIQREEYGGGEIYFDHTLIRKDGKFVLPDLLHLNYDLK